MQKVNGKLYFSATDLTNFLDCAHLTTLDLKNLETAGQNIRETQTKALNDALARAVNRGTLLEAHLKNQEDEYRLYFLNSAKGRAALKALQNGDWQPDIDARAPVQLEMERPNIYRLYEDNIGPLTPLIADALREAEITYPADWIEEAMRKAVLNNARHWRYIETILARWKEKGRDATDRRDSEKDRRRYIEGELADFIEH